MKHLLLSSLQLGQLLKSARKRMPLNQHELGARVGLSQARISQMESGNPTPSRLTSY
ncbi:MAG: helix-turn-helix transcriptional regulator [Rhodoferax sp.]|uniref:helix-turn-helix domain-containing protein n=1 Tax=Rhodoferax sp. TaxID=50421 RepID=UPI003C74E1F0